MVTRNNFDSYWLEPNNGKTYSKFDCLSVKEKNNSRNKILPHLKHAIHDHHIHPKRIDLIKKLGFVNSAEYICNLLPTNDSTRKGNLGEVIACEHLCQRYGFSLPIFKLRYMDHPEMPMRGEDIIALEFNGQGNIQKICIGEAKTISTYRSRTVTSAHSRLLTACINYPRSLPLISSILCDMQEYHLASQIESLIANPFQDTITRENWIFLITENNPKDAFKPVEDLNEVVDELKVVHLRLKNLADFINKIF